LKTGLSLSEDRLDLPVFTALAASVTDEVGFAMPFGPGENFPTIKNVLENLAITVLLKVGLNNDNLITISQTGPAGSAVKTIEDDEILSESFKYIFNYADIKSDILIEYNAKEVSDRFTSGNLFFDTAYSSSNTAQRLHEVSAQQLFQSLHFLDGDAQKLADRLKFVLGDRRGTLSFTTKNRFFDTLINQAIIVSRNRMPGFPFDTDTNRDRLGVVLASSKSLEQITISLEDQKGIEDNSTSW
jgi:hypothetical protein